MTDPAPARETVDQHALFSTLAQIQVLEHQRQWCEMDALSAVEDELEIQERHLKRLLCPGLSSAAPLPALTPPAPIAAPAQAEAEAKYKRALGRIASNTRYWKEDSRSMLRIRME